MECPRCGSALERYALQGHEAVVCESCGYIGVPVEHHGELTAFESWDDAIDRFQRADAVEAVTVETSEGDTVDVFDDGGGGSDANGRDDTGGPSPLVVRVEGSPVDHILEDVNGTVACDVCGKSFDEQAQLNGHMAVHSRRE